YRRCIVAAQWRHGASAAKGFQHPATVRVRPEIGAAECAQGRFRDSREPLGCDIRDAVAGLRAAWLAIDQRGEEEGRAQVVTITLRSRRDDLLAPLPAPFRPTTLACLPGQLHERRGVRVPNLWVLGKIFQHVAVIPGQAQLIGNEPGIATPLWGALGCPLAL